MFRIITETAGTISHADYLSAMDLSSKVALFNVNYRRPYWVVTLAKASLLSFSAAPVISTNVWLVELTAIFGSSLCNQVNQNRSLPTRVCRPSSICRPCCTLGGKADNVHLIAWVVPFQNPLVCRKFCGTPVFFQNGRHRHRLVTMYHDITLEISCLHI